SFPQRRLAQARSAPEVKSAYPVYLGRIMWRNPVTRYWRSLVVLAFRPGDPVTEGRNPEIDALRHELTRPDTVLIDRLSRPEVGPQEVGLSTQVGTRNLETVGLFTIGPGFEAGQMIVSDQTFSRLYGGYPLSDVSLGLIRLRPGADPE